MYLNERRLAAAAEALRRTEDKILTIAESVGFENLSNFNRQFKKVWDDSQRIQRIMQSCAPIWYGEDVHTEKKKRRPELMFWLPFQLLFISDKS